MKKLLTIVLVLTLFTGCFLHKKRKHENRKIKSVENVETVTTRVDDEHTDTKLSKRSLTDIADKTVTTAKEINYSKPDSTGVQYKVVERIIERRNDVTAHNEFNEQLLEIKDKQIQRLENENKRIERLSNEIIKLKEKNETQTPWSLLFTAFVLGMVTVIVVKLWIKKPKWLQGNRS